MKRLAIAAATAAAILTAPAAMAAPRLKGEAKLAQILEGRVAGEPRKCLPYTAGDSVRIVDRTALVYGNGSTLWVNRPVNADTLDDDDILVHRSYTSRMCDLDTLQLIDRTSRFYSGFVGLNEFVPYRKVAVND